MCILQAKLPECNPSVPITSRPARSMPEGIGGGDHGEEKLWSPGRIPGVSFHRLESVTPYHGNPPPVCHIPKGVQLCEIHGIEINFVRHLSSTHLDGSHNSALESYYIGHPS